jgi:hypothetical protein
MKRKHASMYYYDFQPINQFGNLSQNFQGDPANLELPNYGNDIDNTLSTYYAKKTNANSIFTRQISLVQEIKAKLEELDNIGLFHISLFLIDLKGRRSNSRYGNSWFF